MDKMGLEVYGLEGVGMDENDMAINVFRVLNC